VESNFRFWLFEPIVGVEDFQPLQFKLPSPFGGRVGDGGFRVKKNAGLKPTLLIHKI
jgi:hypothetical protein